MASDQREAMRGWTAIVLAASSSDDGAMASKVPSYLHPVAGRPLIWHTVNSLALRDNPPGEVVIVAPDVTTDLFDGVPLSLRLTDRSSLDTNGLDADAGSIVLVHASATLEAEGLHRLLEAGAGAWVGDSGSTAAVSVESDQLSRLLESDEPLALAASERPEPVGGRGACAVVRTRADLAHAHRRIRDQLVRSLMQGGVTFLLPESVLVDVAVRVGRDSIIYPGVVLEGQTNIGEETVIGPGCRIIDSWIGSGVELKGWNYVANTSVRNRAILEPHVRRGFD